MNIFGEFQTLGAIDRLNYEQQSLASKAVGMGTAVLADTVVTMADSITFGSFDLDTGSVLGAIGLHGARTAYEQNTEAVQLMSFVGGVFVPGMAAVKLTKAVRDGNKMFNALSSTRKSEDLVKMRSLIENGQQGHQEYKRLRNSMLLRGQAENILDTVAVEAAIMGTFNAHPFMEDYLDEPVKNLAISLALGGAIGGAINGIQVRTAIRGVQGEVISDALTQVIKSAKLDDANFLDSAATVINRDLAASNIESFIKSADVSPLVKEIGTNISSQLRASAGDMVKESIPNFTKLSAVEKEALGTHLRNTQFLGVDTVDFYTPDKKAFLRKDKAVPTLDQKSKPKWWQATKEGEAGTSKFVSKHIYHPESQSFIDGEMAHLISSAADQYKAKDVTKRVQSATIGARSEKSLNEIRLGDSATAELDYLAREAYYTKLSDTNWSLVHISTNDASSLMGAANGWQHQLDQARAALAKETDHTLLAGHAKDIQALESRTILVGKDRVGLEQLTEMAYHAKSKNILEDLHAGMPPETVAIRNNVMPEAVHLMASDPAAAYSFTYLESLANQEAKSLLSRFHGPSAIDQALSPTRRLVVASGSEANHSGRFGLILDKEHDNLIERVTLTKREAAYLNQMDSAGAQRVRDKIEQANAEMTEIRKEFVDVTMTLSESQLAKTLWGNLIDHDDIKVLREGIGNFVAERMGNSLINSADFVLRDLGDLGRLVTHIGDTRHALVNKFINDQLSGISTGFRQLSNNPAARAEFATIEKEVLSLRGQRWYSDEHRAFVNTLEPTEDNPVQILSKVVRDDSVHNLLLDMQEVGREMYEARRTVNRLANRQTPKDIGFWHPPVDLTNKEYAYLVDVNTGTKQLLIADDLKQLDEMTKGLNLTADQRVVSRTQASLDNRMIGDEVLGEVTYADVMANRRGITGAVPDISAARLEELVRGYMAQTNQLATGLIEHSMFDVMGKLDMLSNLSQRALNEVPKTGWRKNLAQVKHKDSAQDVKDYLLGRNPAHRSGAVKSINTAFDTLTSVAGSALDSVLGSFKSASKADKAMQTQYRDYISELAAHGVPNPYKAFDEALRPQLLEWAKTRGHKSDPARVVNVFNGIAATMTIRFMEIAQPLVNFLSVPIMHSSVMSREFAAGNIQTAGSFYENSSQAILMNGIRRMNSKDPRNVRLNRLAEGEGLFESTASEVNRALMTGRIDERGLVAKMEQLLDRESQSAGARIMRGLSKPSDLSDSLLRQAAFNTGIEVGIRKYGSTASDKQLLIYARDYVKQTQGNYSQAQRPAVFQGSFGSAMGLFQTFMLTYAQNMYSHVAKGDMKGLGKMMLAQAGVFGTASLPGFNAVSELIGEHFSNENFDLKTGLYRALPSSLASTIVYGLPSNLVGALHTRGDVSPRVPAGFMDFVAPSVVAQTIETGLDLAKAASRFDSSAGGAILEALSTQSVNRPIARLSELISGRAVTKQGTLIAGSEEVWSATGIMARVFSVRPLNEAVAREANHLNTYYGQLDRASRKTVVKHLQQHMRSNTLTPDAFDDLATKYLRTGTPQGFRQAINQAFLDNSNPGIKDFTKTFKDSPLILLVEDLD